VAPETEHENLQQQLENSEIDPDFEHLDIDNLNNTQSISVPIPTTSTSCLVTSESFVQFILDDIYRKHVQSLNKEQQQFFFQFVLNWCLDKVNSNVTKKHLLPLDIFISGGAGTEKSHLIKAIHQMILRTL
jgi:transcriptional regulator of aromatic amino acid metabolism